jgi:hypothetical protein
MLSAIKRTLKPLNTVAIKNAQINALLNANAK